MDDKLNKYVNKNNPQGEETLQKMIFSLKQIICIYEVGFETIVKILNNTPDFQYYENDKFKQQNALKYITQVLVNIKTLTANSEVSNKKNAYKTSVESQYQSQPSKGQQLQKNFSTSTVTNPVPWSSSMSKRCQNILIPHNIFSDLPPCKNELEISIPNPMQLPEEPRPSKLMIIKYPSVPPTTNVTNNQPHTVTSTSLDNLPPEFQEFPFIRERLQEAGAEIIYTSPSGDYSLDLQSKPNADDIELAKSKINQIPCPVGSTSKQQATLGTRPRGQNPCFAGTIAEDLETMDLQSTNRLIKLLRHRMNQAEAKRTVAAGIRPSISPIAKPDNQHSSQTGDSDVVLIGETNQVGRQVKNWQEHTASHVAVPGQIRPADSKIGFTVDGILAKKTKTLKNPDSTSNNTNNNSKNDYLNVRIGGHLKEDGFNQAVRLHYPANINDSGSGSGTQISTKQKKN